MLYPANDGAALEEEDDDDMAALRRDAAMRASVGESAR